MYLEHQKTSSRIYHVTEEETKRESKGERMCRGPLSSKIQPRIEIEYTHRNIMSSRRFICDEYIGLQIQTKECNWTRRWFHNQQVEIVWYTTSMWHIFVVMDDITVIGWLHWHEKNYWLYTWRCICTICVNERQYQIHNFLFPYINGSTSRVQWSFTNT